MEKIYVQRLVSMWVEDTYRIPEISDENLQKAIDYEIEEEYTEVLYDTQESIGPVEVYDEDRHLLMKNYEYE